jgi:hypothetical protein
MTAGIQITDKTGPQLPDQTACTIELPVITAAASAATVNSHRFQVVIDASCVKHPFHVKLA